MTWKCPRCERKYPDSTLGRPKDADAGDKSCCKLCVGPERKESPNA